MKDDHIHAFVSECRESITDLNNALLTLEDDPDDSEAIESVFRTAHTLKGNFGAMGFSNASELAHVLEDLLDEIRTGEIAVTSEIMDAGFEGVDRIETTVDEIERDGESKTNPEETTERLRNAIENARAGGGGGESGAAPLDEGNVNTDPPDHDAPVPTIEGIDELAHGRIDVDPDGMLSVDGLLILEPLATAIDDLRTVPNRQEIEAGEYNGSFDVYAPETSAETLGEQLDEIGAIASFEVDEVDMSEGTNGVAPESNTNSKGKLNTNSKGESNADPESEPADGDGGISPSSGKGQISSVRVDVDRLDELHGLVEQLVTGRITIRRAIEEEDIETAASSLNDFDKVTSRLQNTVMDMRLIPLRRVVNNLPRVVRDVARDQGKDVSFDMYGEDIELDRSILTEIEDPLIHILRNAVDHGVESPEDREMAGKPREGTIELRASRQRDHVTIVVSDDGGGIDPEKMRANAVDEGIISESEANAMTDAEAYDFVFHPGFSTAGEVTDVSGRGVGMDVVHSTVEQLDGTVSVDSSLGEGTTVELRLPVSVAIVDVLFVEVGEREYGIPIKNIDELTHAGGMETVNKTDVVRHDDEVYPVIHLEEALELEGSVVGNAASEAPIAADGGDPAELRDEGMLVRIRESVRPVALRCDSFSDQEEVVVKPLEGSLSGTPGIGGTAILGDGHIVPILDVVSLDE